MRNNRPTGTQAYGWYARRGRGTIRHQAFRTEQVEGTFAGLKAAGRELLVEVVGSPEKGLRQTFSRPLGNTLMVNGIDQAQ